VTALFQLPWMASTIQNVKKHSKSTVRRYLNPLANDIVLSSINPKSGSVKGGTELTLLINIDPVTAESLFHLTVGFQPKARMPMKIAGKKVEFKIDF
jgi:hypothetical protein